MAGIPSLGTMHSASHSPHSADLVGTPSLGSSLSYMVTHSPLFDICCSASPHLIRNTWPAHITRPLYSAAWPGSMPGSVALLVGLAAWPVCLSPLSRQLNGLILLININH
ncbi:hypothetical protein ACFE04_010557 [Oxalis oulophora]